MTLKDLRIHELTFCGRVKSWADAIFHDHSGLPFKRAEIEESKGIKKKRSDLRIYESGGKLILAGEVKLPGTPEGRNPYDHHLVEDSYLKASNAGARYFFTWNINKLVLFDASLWQKPLYERRVKEFDLQLDLDNPLDVERADVQTNIQKFLQSFFIEFAGIASGEVKEWGMPPDELFIRSFESHISWAVKLTTDYLSQKVESDKRFDERLQDWMSSEQGWEVIRNDNRAWRILIDRSARTLCYIFSNRLIFYESCRIRFDELSPLAIPKGKRTPTDIHEYFQKKFQEAVNETGDYETLFYPNEKAWSDDFIFQHPEAIDAWHSILENLKPFNFKKIRSDILGGIFRRLIAPEERRRFGQIYTNEDLVDLVNSFCLRKGTDTVLDPACGSGSFLVRAYHRKAWLSPNLRHQDLIKQTYGCDISLFAAHLATLNLAAREIIDEENYPRIARRNFFEIESDKVFCRLPSGLKGERKVEPIVLPKLDAVVGNPPYVRQERISKRRKGVKRGEAKEDLQEQCTRLWPGLHLSGRSDLHCYFWPVSSALLKENGWFGFLVSSSWLDVEYGFPLQQWILQNFKIHVIIESQAEPWFADARVKTCAVILQCCKSESERSEQLVKFVQLRQRLADIFGEREDENARQEAAERLRNLITRTKEAYSNHNLRIIVKKQDELWSDGVRTAKLLFKQKSETLSSEDEDTEEGTVQETTWENLGGREYGGGKWGKYVRAPDFYFDLMRRYGEKFVAFGEIATIRFGVKSGCDAFFMPRDITDEFLEKYPADKWRSTPLVTHCNRKQVENGEVKIIRAGDGTVHPVETKFLAPEVHSLMDVSRPIVSIQDLDRLVLMVSQPMSELGGTYVLKYLKYGEKSTFASKKSKAVPVPKRETCAARNTWYDLTYTRRGHIIWPKSQQYRHLALLNQNRLIVNCNLYDITLKTEELSAVTAAILNSTLVAFSKIYYGRYAGTEGNLKTEVIDVNMLEIPDPRNMKPELAKRVRTIFGKLCQRDTMPMVEEALKECHDPDHAAVIARGPLELPLELAMPDRRELDLAVFELLGVADSEERSKLCDKLYEETAKHFRHIRVVEIQKQQQRSDGEDHGFRSIEMATDLWDALASEERIPLVKWLQMSCKKAEIVTIPDAQASIPEENDMLDPSSVFFRLRTGQISKLGLSNRSQAEIVFLLWKNGIRGKVAIPCPEEAKTIFRALQNRILKIGDRCLQLARSRTTDEARTEDIAGMLIHWVTLGKEDT